MLAIYLNDHLAAATAGRELARRAARSNRASSYGAFLERLADEIDEDRESLLAIMRALQFGANRLKVAGAWGAEKLGRLKLNGRLLGYSPLSRLLELEVLVLGVTGKLALWHTLESLKRDETALGEFDLARLIERAGTQLDQLETHRQRAIAEAFARAT